MSEYLAALGPTDAAGFLRVFNRLCVALRETADDSGVTQDVYYEALKDLPLEALELAATSLSRDRGRRFFPTTAEWRDTALKIQQTQLRAQLGETRVWHTECETCSDTGWQRFDCSGGEDCGRRNTHAAHEYVRPCFCRPTNRTYQRKREAELVRR